MLTKFGESLTCIAGGIFVTFLMYAFWPTFLNMWDVGLSEITHIPQHSMILAFCNWLPLPLFLLPAILSIALIVWIWRQPD